MAGRILLALVVIAIGAGALWLRGEHIVASHLAQTDEWNAIRQSEAVLKVGLQPTDWPVRGFVPAAVLQSVVETLKDAEVDVPLGDAKDEHVDGFVHFVVQSVKLVPEDLRFGVVLATEVSYRPDRERPWWGGATANVERASKHSAR